MAICSYLVVPADGAFIRLAERLAALPGCEVACARNHDLLVLVTDTPGPAEEAELRSALDSMPDVRALMLTFGEINR